MEKTIEKTAGRKQPKVIYETPHYRVFVAALTLGKDDKPELMVQYVVQFKEPDEPVIYGVFNLRGAAVAAALTAEAMLIRAYELVEKQEANGFRPEPSPAPAPHAELG